ncbi:YbaB/EbfC family nucleoid-associated protein [Streptomyces sp. NPDC087659]|uniref:YbaB/EbfC family nucleoid-associated protein n=1 Tax=Streptomyces sp. NPDC087659 TaxID=3365801 RepID=UPI0038071059
MNDNRHNGGEQAAKPPFADMWEQRIAEAMADLEATQASVAKAEEELKHTFVTVRSEDRAVEVTVGAQGELTGLQFLDGKYRNMDAAELAASVLESASEARLQISRKVVQAFKPFTEPRMSVPGMKGLDIDWEKIFGPGVLDDPDGVTRRPGGHHLQDEINEESEDDQNHG